MSTLYIRHPSKAASDADTVLEPPPCLFALVADNGVIEREGSAALAALSDAIRQARRVVLLLAASDVSLLRVKVPPLSAARLKAALPNLVEDQLMSDPADCVFVAGPLSDGLRTVAVVQRAWLERLSNTLTAQGARQLTVLPAQLCLPFQAGAATAAIAECAHETDITLRLSQQDGVGLSVTAAGAAAMQEVIAALRTIVPQAPLTVYVPPASMRPYQQIASDAGDPALNVLPDSWAHWVSGAKNLALDLMAGLGASAGPQIDWRPWRWPLGLALLLILVNLFGLNLDWLRMKREANLLRAGMTQTFQSTFPKEHVIVDPMAQMRQKLAAAKHDAGQLAADDFTALAATFGDAWTSVMQSRKGAVPAIATLEYRERSLLVRFKPGADVPTTEMTAALAARNAALAQTSAGVWQIRSAK